MNDQNLKKVVVIGAVAAGPKVASRFKRLSPNSDVVMLDRADIISYGGCGIPYYVSGDVQSLDALRATAYNTVRDPMYFEQRGIRTFTHTLATSIDRNSKKVYAKDLHSGEEIVFPYDKLVIATGASPKIPPVKGSNLINVLTATSLESAENIKKAVEKGEIENAVIVGAGFIGLEMAVALADMWGINVTVVEFMDQVMPGVLSADLADMIKADLERHNVKVHTSESVLQLEGGITGTVSKVITNKREIDAELVIFATGFAPNSQLAIDAGLDIDPKTKGIIVDEYMRTSDKDIYAAGDCVAIKSILTGQPICLQLGSIANRQGRIVGTNLAGGDAKFSGGVGTWCVKLFDYSACGVGLTLSRAKQAGFNAKSVMCEQLDRAHFYPEKSMMTLELTFDATTRQILGVQGFCKDGDALKARIDAVAMLLQFGPHTLDDLANAELGYAPPFSAALDVLNVVANVADNVLSGQMNGISSREFSSLWENRHENGYYFADARPEVAGLKTEAKYPGAWHVLPLERVIGENSSEYIDKLPKNGKIVLICNTGLRAFNVMLSLKNAGINNVVNTMGGMQSLIKRGCEI